MTIIKNSTRIAILIVLACIGFVLGMVFFFVWKANEIPAKIIGSIFGVIISAIVTMLLLSAQSDSEEEHEVSGKIFDKKTEAYLNVLDSLEKIIFDGKVDTIRDNKFDSQKPDELSQLLFSLTRLSSFIEVTKNSETKDMNSLIDTVTDIIKATTEEGSRIPDSTNKNFWNGKGKKSPNETLTEYYSKLADSLSEISKFATKNIQRNSKESSLDLKKLVSQSGLFPKGEIQEIPLSQNEENSSVTEESMENYRIDCIANCLEEMESQLKAQFGEDKVERTGEAGDDYYWGRWKRDYATPEAIAYWLIEKPRRNEIGYSVDLNDGFSVEFCLYGDAKTFGVYIWATTDELKRKAQEKHDLIKGTFGNAGWWVPDDFSDWIIGGSYGGDYNGVSLSFDFRNASMEESEYKAAYKRFKENAIQGMISRRDDSIVKAADELKKLIES